MTQYFQNNMKNWNVPGVAVAVVKNGEELYKSGFVVSDVETQNPVDPDSTTFPAASVSKLFTATAIMQLYQKGKLDLNENIQSYLDDISIKNPYKEEVTCQNLLTHSSGLDEGSELDGGTLDKDAIKSSKQYFKEHIPSVIIRPNSVCRYSNIGYNLLGYIVEKVSGKSYEKYVTNNILEPLDMKHSSVRIENDSMASGYEYSDGKYQKTSFAYQYTSGSSGVISTVSDMENFMIMHLNNGMFKDNCIIDADTEMLMQKKQFANHEVFDGMGEGFIRSSRNGVHILKHEGALPGYTTTLLLLPNQKFGIYVATNSLNGMLFNFEKTFLDYFLGVENVVNNEENTSNNIDKYVGTYRSYDGISIKNISKIFASIDDTAEFKVNKAFDGNLTVSFYEQSKEKVSTKLIDQSNGIFLRKDGKGYITFREDKNGNIKYVFNNISHQTYLKIRNLGTMQSICLSLLFLILILLGSFLIIIIKAIRRKLKNNRKLWLMNGFINMLYVVDFVGIFVLEAYMILHYDYRLVWTIYILLTVIFLTILLNIYSLFIFGYGIIKKKFDKRTILKFTMIQMVQLLFIINLAYFNMIGYHVF
ncbi:serine hydrolase domain-containing protein [Anaerosacchariphilus polymeriproducens]|uniref:Class A beta-lactamase-related serine hydrolase n=1 Tax=Anaerosacchariphilus polymeriproducens TaxID=1812858 RepID=A0A371B0C7_9FIRM|nr:serine hydrolase domain-containing protein [Anaerosacchariphilus polymeriproducens]RDU25202.1 class A beta-lactamase-related serine hydrolase [Anaerosacchariphilus polymeriproducens]